jgi:hypothetical protein
MRWNPPWVSKPLGAVKVRPITVWVEPPHKRGPRGLWTLVVKWSDSPYRTEVRGMFDVEGRESEFQRVIDALPGNLVGGELFAGNTAHVNDRSYAPAYPVLARLLAD